MKLLGVEQLSQANKHKFCVGGCTVYFVPCKSTCECTNSFITKYIHLLSLSLSLSQARTADVRNQLRCDYWERLCFTLYPSQNITLSIKRAISQCDVCYQLGTGNYRLPCGVCCCTECLRVCITENFKQLEKIRPTFASNADRLLWCPCVGNCDKQMIPSLVDGKALITRPLCVSIVPIMLSILMYFIAIARTQVKSNHSCARWRVWSLRQEQRQAEWCGM